jgi:hypothetical protein
MGITWIASYPKSGNTLVRFLLANYLAGRVTDSNQVEAAVPTLSKETDAARLLATNSPLCMKTHLPWTASHPFADQTDRAVVIVRYPKDILLSHLDYFRLIIGHEGGFQDETYVRAFIATGGDPRWKHNSGYGTLLDHPGSWLDDPSAPKHILVRYEDLVHDAARELTRILGFIGVPVDAGRVRMAAEASSFDQMRKLEVREKAVEKKLTEVFPGKLAREGWSRFFVNQARIGSTIGHIRADLDEKFDRRFEALVKRLGYEGFGAGTEGGAGGKAKEGIFEAWISQSA